MRSYAASELEIFRRVRVPTALPYVFTALKVASVLAMIGAIVGEYFGGSFDALGVLIRSDAQILDFTTAWAGIVVASLLGIALYLAVVGRRAARSSAGRPSSATPSPPALPQRAPLSSRAEPVRIPAMSHPEEKESRMKKRWVLWLAGGALAAALTIGAGAATATTRHAQATNITLQLKWVPQAQFAGYYAAVKQGFYAKEGLNVTLKNGGPDIIPEQVVASGQAQFGVDWLPSLLAARDKGTDLVNVAQVFARSGMTQLTWKSSGITTIADMKGKKVANWLGGNQYELFAALVKNGMNPDKNQGVTIVQQPFDMNLFLKQQVDSASAMTYNELAQVLESKNPKTGKLYTLADLNVIKMQNVGTGMLEDGLFSTGSWLKSPANQAIAVKFIKASLEGWIYCRDHAGDLRQRSRSQYGPTLPKGHQTWHDERDQQADLAERGRDRDHEQGRLRPDGDDREAVRRDLEGAVGRLPHRPRRQGGRPAEGGRRRRVRQELEARDGDADGRREVAKEGQGV